MSSAKILEFKKLSDKFAEEGYKLLPSNLINSKSKIQFICPRGHRYEIAYGKWFVGQRCGMCVKWLSADEKKLSELYPFHSMELIAKGVGKTKNAVVFKIKHLKLDRRRHTEEEFLKIHENIKKGLLKKIPAYVYKQKEPSFIKTLIFHFLETKVGHVPLDIDPKITANRLKKEGYGQILHHFRAQMLPFWEVVCPNKSKAELKKELRITSYKQGYNELRKQPLPKSKQSKFIQNKLDALAYETVSKIVKDHGLTPSFKNGEFKAEVIKKHAKWIYNYYNHTQLISLITKKNPPKSVFKYHVYAPRGEYKIQRGKYCTNRLFKWDKEEDQRNAILMVLNKIGVGTAEEAGLKFTKEVIMRYDLSGLMASRFKTVYSMLYFIYGDEIKPWMLNRAPKGLWGAKDNPNKIVIKEALDWLSLNINKPVKDLTNKDLSKYRMFGLTKIFNYNIRSIIEFAYDMKIKPWEMNKADSGFWKSKENVKEALAWLIEKKLQIPIKNVPEIISTELLVEHGLGGMIGSSAYESFSDAIIELYPHMNFKKTDFRYPTINTLLGTAFELFVHDLLSNELRIKYLKNKPFKGCRHAKKCRPDIQMLDIDGIISSKDVGDIKLHSYTLEVSDSARYTSHGEKLKIFYLNSNEYIHNNPKIEFVQVSRLLDLVKNRNRKNALIRELDDLRRGVFPKQYQHVEKSRNSKAYHSICKLAHLGKCTHNKKQGIMGIVSGNGFCVRHNNQYRNGYIDYEGNQLKSPLDRNIFTPKQEQYIKDNYLTKSNGELALMIYGVNTQKYRARISAKIGIMIENVDSEKRRQNLSSKITWDKRKRNILKKNFKTKTNLELCSLLGVAPTMQNASYVSGALQRMGLSRGAKAAKRKTWTQHEDEKLVKLFAHKSKAELAKIFKATENQIKRRVATLKLRKR